MDIFIKGHNFVYEIENVVRMFEPDAHVREGRPDGENCVYARLSVNTCRTRIFCYTVIGGKTQSGLKTLPPDAARGDLELELAVMLYEQLCLLSGRRQPWGVMTGVRPAKFANSIFARTGDYRLVAEILENKYLVTPQKAALAVDTAQRGARIAALSEKRDVSVYAAIPFCPTRCAYCSFVSKTTERDGALVEPYLDALETELQYTAELLDRLGLRVRTVYIGGGTPTVLNVGQLTRLTRRISACFDIGGLLEYTVEAGRPDTVDEEKFSVLSAAGVTRVSINPQTFNDDVLRAVGRRHTAAQTETAFALAQRAGFACINTDLIAGLPTDTLESFRRSVDRAIELAPDNITVHALTLKRASNLADSRPQTGPVSEMVDYSQLALARNGYHPYYMYKQKSTVENLENVGYALDSREGYYNVFMMDEIHSVISCGASAVTKLVDPVCGEIERIFNYKYPLEYIKGLQEMLARKSRLEAFYESVL